MSCARQWKKAVVRLVATSLFGYPHQGWSNGAPVERVPDLLYVHNNVGFHIRWRRYLKQRFVLIRVEPCLGHYGCDLGQSVTTKDLLKISWAWFENIKAQNSHHTLPQGVKNLGGDVSRLRFTYLREALCMECLSGWTMTKNGKVFYNNKFPWRK